VDATHAAVVTPAGDTVTRSTGLSETEADEVQLGPAPTGKRVRSFVVSYDASGGEDAPVESALVLPLRGGDEVIGLLAVFTRAGAAPLPVETTAGFEDLAASAGPAVENARRYHEARRLADIDSHTGLHNRRYFHETLAREVARSGRYERPLALIVFDVDDFKSINDRFGHLAGDTVLGQVGERVRGVVRTADIACRVGGDEFGVILPESTLEDAEQLCERLKSHMALHPIPQAGRLQISAGIAGLRPQDDAVSLFERADDALYRAKEAGKGRIAIATTAIGRSATEVAPSAISRIEREEG
jgi:diguanylate cyclase (GGDEF)-like protein